MGNGKGKTKAAINAYRAAQCRRREVCTLINGTLRTFPSIKAASAATGVPSPSICNSCRYGIIVKGGYQFMYKNHLNLHDIHIGDWVQEYSEFTGKPSMPMFVSAIFADGTIYLDFDGNEGDVWEANIENVAPIKIDKDILKGFGFTKGPHGTDWVRKFNDLKIVFDANPYLMNFFIKYNDGTFSETLDCNYINEMQSLFRECTKKPLVLNWKGL